MGSQAKRQWQDVCRCGMWAFLLLVLGATSAYAQFDRGTISGTDQRRAGRRRARRDRHDHEHSTQQARTTVTDGSGFYTLPEPSARQVRHLRRAPGLQESQSHRRPGRRGVRVDPRFRPRDRLADRGSHGHRRSVDAADRRGGPQDRRSERHRAAVVLRPQSDRRARAQGRASSAATSTTPAFACRSPTAASASTAAVPTRTSIYVDGAVAIRTRSAGTIIGVQNVDAVQEVQVLTANYMPEYGRASGGQIRFITKSGSNRYTGNASFFWRDESLQANTWAPQPQHGATENSGPAPFDYKQYGYSFGGPIPGSEFKDKLFFFVRPGVGRTSSRCRPTPRPCRPRRCGAAISASCWRRQRLLQHGADHPRPADGPAVPGQRHPDRAGCRATASRS